MITRFKVFLILQVILFILSISICRALILLSPLCLFFFRDIIPGAVSYIYRIPVGLLCELKSNYVYFPKRGRIIVVYRVEPLLNLERLKGETYVSLVRDFVKRILVNDDIAVGFLVKRDVKYLIVNLEYRNVENSKSILSSIENILGEYFMFRRVEGRDLEILFTHRKLPASKILSFLTFSILIGYLLLNVYGAISSILSILVTYLTCRELYVYDSFSSLKFSCSRNRLLFVMRDPDSVKSDALHVSRCRCSYLIMFRRCRELEAVAREKLHREQEALVVKEKGRSYSEVLAWRNVIDRLNLGEEPLEISLNTSTRDLEPYFNLHVGDICYLFDPYRTCVYSLTNDIAMLIPMHSSSGTVYESSRRIFLGYDRSGREVLIDIDSLPNNHIIIVGPTGMGKSWTCKTVLTELVKNDISIIVIDPHGEYVPYLREKYDDVLEVRFPESFVNIFEIGDTSLQDKMYRLFTSLCEVLNYEIPPHILDIVEQIYQKAKPDPVKMLTELTANVDDYILRLFFKKLLDYYSKCRIIPITEISRHKIVVFNFKKVLSDVDVLRFLMLMLTDLLYSYLSSLEISQKLRYIITIDEAYYIMNSRIIELSVKGLRKLGVGILLITQTVDNIRNDILQNIGLSIILGGPDPYVESISSTYLLNYDDVLWLSTSLPPSSHRRSTRALLMMGPIKKHVSIILR